MRELIATDEDYRQLFRVNPLAAEQLKSIVLTRLLNEAEARSENGKNPLPSTGAGKDVEAAAT